MRLNIALAAIIASPGVSAFTITSHNGVSSTSFGTKKDIQPLFGILDEVNSDAFNLLGNDAPGESASEKEQAYEVFLGQLVFSTNDPRLDIVENLELCRDPVWIEWLDNKIKNSTDAEEKGALRDLYEMIADIVKRVEYTETIEKKEMKEKEQAEIARIAAVEAEAAEGRTLSDTDLLRKAGTMLGANDESEIAEKKSFYDTELTTEIRASYDALLKKVLPPYQPGSTVDSVVFANYDQFDAQFIKLLKERSDNGDSESQGVLDALSKEQGVRMATATDTLKEVLSMGEPRRMEGAIVRLAKEGKVNEPFLLLLEANFRQAKDAGATEAAEIMRRLSNRALAEKDKDSTSKEIKLLRQLLRAEKASEREALLVDAFTPKQGLLVPGTSENAAKALEGEAPEEEKPYPEVPPPDFINACKAVLLNFGNLSAEDEKGDLQTQIKQIAAEAEAVATRIYGVGMSVKEQQDRMWKEQTTSIFDLETLEIEAERMGEEAPWGNPNNDDILPGFDKDGRMRVGGG